MTVSEDWYEKEYGNQSIWLQARKKDVEDSTNPLTEVKTTTKDANGNETTVIKKGKFDKELATKKAYEQAVAEATNPVGMLYSMILEIQKNTRGVLLVRTIKR